MDHRRIQQRPSIPVNIFGSPAPFPRYLRSAVVNDTYALQQYHQPHPPRQPWSLPSQPLPQRQSHRPSRYSIGKQVTIMNPMLNNQNQAFAPGYSTEDAKAMLTGNWDDVYNPALSAMPTIYHQPAYGQHPFRPLNPAQSFDSSVQTIPSKVEVDRSATIMPLQTTHVDPRHYSPVSHKDVFDAPYDASSPSSIDTTGDSPATPALDQYGTLFDHYAMKHGAPDARFYSGITHATHSQQTVQTSFGSFTSDNSISNPGSSFSAQDTVAHHPTSSEQLRGLAINYAPARNGLRAPAVAAPTFHSQAESFDESFSEPEFEDDATSAASSPSSAEAEVRSDRDKLLLGLRNQGYSYKEIKRLGGFKEAESTLRGRMRVLTKEKHERVRKPVWRDSDVQLLRRAVKKCHGKMEAAERSRPSRKLPWLRISNWMRENGASYHFAPATCAKKWADVERK